MLRERNSDLRLGGAALPLTGRARVYACGITPYDVTHLGHAATFVWVDTLVRVLRRSGSQTVLCRNVTDVDDVLTEAARRSATPYDRLAAVQEYRFDHDMAALGAYPPDLAPRAHTHIDQVIALAGGLLDRDAGYARDGGVYQRATWLPDQPARDTALRLAEEFADDPADPAKDDPLDVAVWRPSSADEPGWDSPWGRGRPGWHAECTVMALDGFGPALDILAGGADLRAWHHAWQAAHAEALTGVTPFARAHLHVGLVRVRGTKMAKSLGNLVLVADLLERWPAAVIRLLILDRSWSADWDFDTAGLEAAAARHAALRGAAGRPGDDPAARAAIDAALRDELDVPRALDVAIESGGRPAAELDALLAPT